MGCPMPTTPPRPPLLRASALAADLWHALDTVADQATGTVRAGRVGGALDVVTVLDGLLAGTRALLACDADRIGAADSIAVCVHQLLSTAAALRMHLERGNDVGAANAAAVLRLQVDWWAAALTPAGEPDPATR